MLLSLSPLLSVYSVSYTLHTLVMMCTLHTTHTLTHTLHTPYTYTHIPCNMYTPLTHTTHIHTLHMPPTTLTQHIRTTKTCTHKNLTCKVLPCFFSSEPLFFFT